ncbi:MAG: histidine kinase, partial [Chitinophagaceae bacterium]|nr:histidine kinase [Chitinophagaceae bacterium]
DLNSLQLPPCFYSIEDEQPELWGWNFENEESQILVSVLSGCRKRFTVNDIAILKLVSHNVGTKLLELCLVKELDQKNSVISAINRNQKKVIAERTREIESKNKTLLTISALNAHNLREPLSRILGLINMLDDEKPEEFIKEIIPILKVSANDLDNALQNVINHATKDLSKLKA